MSILRGFGYAIAIIILIVGIVLFPIGLVLIIPAVIMLWALKKGGQVSSMQKDLKAMRKLDEERMRYDLMKKQKEFQAGLE